MELLLLPESSDQIPDFVGSSYDREATSSLVIFFFQMVWIRLI
jgi:hypothetical protein